MLSVQPSWSSLNIFDLISPAAQPRHSADSDDDSAQQPSPGEPETLGEYAYFEFVEVPALWPLKQYP